MIPLIKTRFDRLVLPLGLLGIAAVAAHNWRQWQRDKSQLAERKEPEPLPPLDEWPELPMISVLVAAWNEATLIEQHIESFLALRYPHKELVLCAGGGDSTLQRASRYESPDVKVVPQVPGEGKQHALARSFHETAGDIIFLTDADCMLTNEPFERTLWPVVAGGEQVATGGSQPFEHLLRHPLVLSKTSSQYYNYARPNAPDYLNGLLGRNCAVRRFTLVQTEALVEPAPTGTDFVLAQKLTTNGVRILQVRNSRIISDYPYRVASYIRQQARWHRNVLLHGFRYGQTKELRRIMIASLLGASLLFLPILTVVIAFPLVIPWLMLLTAGTAARMRYMGFYEEATDTHYPLRQRALLGIFLMYDAVAWLLPFYELLSTKRRKRW